jgi:hypothetical protein
MLASSTKLEEFINNFHKTRKKSLYFVEFVKKDLYKSDRGYFSSGDFLRKNYGTELSTLWRADFR